MSDHKGLLKHSRNYLFATLANKALAFISVPIYTRILSVEEYGYVGVFMSLVGIAVVLFSLNSEVAIGRYYYDAKDEDDFKAFVGTTITLAGFILVFTTMFFLLLLPFLADTFSFPKRFIVCLLPVSLYQLTNSVFCQIYNPQMQSKKIAIVTSVQYYLAFVLSVVCMIVLPEEKYMGYVYGNIIAMFLLFVFLYKQIRPFVIISYKKEHLLYILNYCLPYLPYTLSSVILNQFSRIFMGNDQGYTLTGSYVLTTNIASLMLVVIGVTHEAWNPYLFRYMKSRDFKSINEDYNLIWRTTLFCAFALSVFGYELALVLSKGEGYLSTIHVIPYLVLGYVFYQWAYVYLRNTAYTKRNIWNAYCVITSGVANIVLNSYLVPLYHEFGAAIATMLSCLTLFLAGYIVNKYILREYVPKAKYFIIPLSYTIPCLVALPNIIGNGGNIYIIVLIKLIIVICFGGVLFYHYKEDIKRMILQYLVYNKS